MSSDREFFEKIERMNELISRSSTGSPREFAHRLNISESTLYNYVRILKDNFEAPVAYCRYRKSYYYTNSGNILIGFVKLSRKEIKKIKGGFNYCRVYIENLL